MRPEPGEDSDVAAELSRLVRERDLKILGAAGDPSALDEIGSSLQAFVERVLAVSAHVRLQREP